ncbi:MAG: anaerobic ribonucleoside triphosphate reductase [Firmicutes bacterium]|nr:anaerobic ribonucleoside triphosphate reductase [Bacillota bacterium]
MMTGNSNGIRVDYPDNMSEAEMGYYATLGKEDWKRQGKSLGILGKIVITLDGGDVVISPLSHITRVRRITGYLGTEDSFNDGKLAELRDRVNHDDGELNYPSREDRGKLTTGLR